MLLLGAASVVYWRLTERAGAGNVMPYGILQAYSMAILLLMAALTPSRYSLGHYLYWVFGWYLLSKFFETFDVEVMGLGQVVSGHTLKHLAAAVAPVAVCLMLTRRTLVDSSGSR
jgi:dolichol kinase